VRFPDHALTAKATGRGSYARTTPDRHGFPRLLRTRAKQHFGYVTGDLVRAVMPTGKWEGTTSPTGICGYFNGVMDTSGRSHPRRHSQPLGKWVDRWPSGS
jgi:hypothetical protein